MPLSVTGIHRHETGRVAGSLVLSRYPYLQCHLTSTRPGIKRCKMPYIYRAQPWPMQDNVSETPRSYIPPSTPGFLVFTIPKTANQPCLYVNEIPAVPLSLNRFGSTSPVNKLLRSRVDLGLTGKTCRRMNKKHQPCVLR